LKEIAYVNGRLGPLAEAVVSIEDRGYQFADGIYEVVKYFGRKPLRLRAHLNRLEQSAQHMRIPHAPSPDEWLPILESLVEACELPDDETQTFSLYQQVTRGVWPRNHGFPKNAKPAVVAYFRKAPTYSAEQRQGGIALSTQPDERWTRCNIKSVCLLPAIWAKQNALEAGAFEALLVRDGIVTEGSSTNAFCVRNGALYTHPDDGHILSGVTRAVVFEAAQVAGVEVREEALTLEQFLAADEAFITSTTMNVMPAKKLDSKPIGSGKVGPVTQRVSAAVEEIVAQELRQTAAV
jgi:D-alanine transaminase